MSEYIGAKISLISRSDIRYVGILHEINSENSTVALEQVVSYGTEGRRGDPEKEIKPSDTVYEYIVFRGSDVKDLRIEEPAKPQPPKPQVPDDPAILATTQPPNYNRGAAPQQPPPPMPQGQFPGPGQQPGQQFYGQPPMPRPGPGQFSGYMGPYQQPFYGGYMGPQAPVAQNPYIQQQGVMQQPPPVGARGPQAGPIGQAPPPQQPQQQGQAQPSQDNNQSSKQTNGPPGPVGKPPNAQPTPPIPSGSKTTTPAPQQQQARVDSPAQNKAAKDAEKSTGAAPGPSKPIRQSQGPPPYPLTSGAAKTSVPSGPKSTRPQVAPALPLNQPPRQQQNDGDATNQSAAKAEESNEKQPTTDAAAIEELAQKVSQLKTSAPAQNGKPAAQSGPRQQPASGSYGHRGGRGRGNYHGSTRKVEVPATDYDFEEANAKFNKQDLVKEAIAAVPGEATSPTAANGEQADGAVGEPPIPPAEPLYNPGKSFFDNISCENKERAEGGDSQNRRGWKSEEQRKNLETFGQGSVDSYGSRYYRGGWRGRGRGGYRGGRGGYNRGGYQNRSQAVNPQ